LVGPGPPITLLRGGQRGKESGLLMASHKERAESIPTRGKEGGVTCSNAVPVSRQKRDGYLLASQGRSRPRKEDPEGRKVQRFQKEDDSYNLDLKTEISGLSFAVHKSIARIERRKKENVDPPKVIGGSKEQLRGGGGRTKHGSDQRGGDP